MVRSIEFSAILQEIWIFDRTIMKNILHSIAGTALWIAAVAMSFSCGQREAVSPDTGFSTWISAYTGGMLQTDATVRIVFASPLTSLCNADGLAMTEMDRKSLDRLFSFSPALKGTVRIAGDDTVEFIPDEGELRPGTVYKGTFRLGEVVETGDRSLDDFRFTFATAPKEAQMEVEWLMVDDKSPDKAKVVGTLYFSEPPAPDAEMRMLSCSYPDNGYRIRFSRSEDGLSSRFRISGLARGEEDRELVISLDGSSDGFGSGQEEKVIIPPASGFKVLGARLVEAASPYVDITFSQPVDKGSDPAGMFSIDGAGRTWTDINGNIVRLYFESPDQDKMTLRIAAGVRSTAGARIEEPVEMKLAGNEPKPAVEIPLKGNILPDGRELMLPLRAVNLSAVDISVIRIYENNILYFLQDNELDGDSGLRRFGRLICRQTVRLDTDPGRDLGRWQDFAVDLSGLFRQEPGAIYRIRVTFRQEYSLYGKGRRRMVSGSADDAGTLIRLGPESISEEERLIWDTPSPYYYESFYEDGYNWRDRNNPDRPTYYMMGDRFPYCNLMTSDLGVIAKSAGDGKIWVAVNDILSTDPVEGAAVKVYDYQLQVIGEAETDSKGFASVDTQGVPFAVTASSGKSISYLKVTAGSEKSLSRFDTGGQKIEAGLKCFIYGDRGVWRPGDTLHITAMIDDPQDRIPDSHPVTMELYSPLGQFHTRIVNNRGRDGFYVFNIPTAADDPTGTWNAYFKIGGSSFHKALMIETIKPNRLKISLKTNSDVLQTGEKTRFSLSASWLTGPAAAGLDAKVEMNLSPAGKTFEGYEGYSFLDPTVSSSRTSIRLVEATLDGKGNAVKDITMPSLDKAPGMMEARLVSTVQETGGDGSIISQTALFSPYPAYVGIRQPDSSEGYLETDTTHTFDVAIVDRDGNPVKGHRIEYRIFKIDWSWWWESKADELASYVNSSSAKTYGKGSFVSSGKVQEIPFRLDYPEWGRFLIYVRDMDGGHAAGCIFTADWPAYRGRSDRKDPDALTMLTFSTDRKAYRTGEQVTVFVPAAEGGRALVSLENGRQILSSDWVETSATGDTPYRFTVTDEMSPNFYIHISLLQKHGNTSNDLPVRMYGVQPMMVENPESHLYPQIAMPDAVRPLEEFTVRVSEKNGKGMTYTLAIVDEGLLDITAFRTPDPWSAIYAREALGVKTWDLYDNVIGAFGGRLTPMASIGGDQTINRESRQDNRFNPVVKFLGPFTLDRKGNEHSITLPMYVGSVRVMVVAGKDGAYGNAEKTVPVRTPLMVLPTAPRSLAPGERFDLPVNVFAMENPDPDVEVSVSVEGAAQMVSDAMRRIRFEKTGDKLVGFSLRTTGEGTAKITVTATGSGGCSATETVSVPVRNPNPYVTARHGAMLDPDSSISMDYGPLDLQDASATLELASFPAMDIHGTFRYMLDYGNDCSEQLAARGITLLSLKKFLSAEETAAVDSLVPLLLGKLYGRQLADGGFPVWPGQAVANEWVSSMAGQFMSLAAARGHEVNKGVYSAWLNFQRRCVRNYKESSHADKAASVREAALNQAYRLYTLALASAPEDGAMNRLRESATAPAIAKWMLASAYASAGKKAVAKGTVSGLKSETIGYSPDSRTYGSPLRDKAIMLESLVLTDDIRGALELAEEIAEDSGTRALSTQYSAFMASAVCRLADRLNTGALHAEFRYGGTASGNATEKINSASAFVSRELDISAKSVEITNLSEGPVYAIVTTREKPAADEAIPAFSSDIALSVSWTDLGGNPVDPENLIQGTDFKASVTVKNNSGTRDMSSLALSIPVASGWEIFNERLYGAGDAATASGYEYMDIRDDRAMYCFDLPKGTEKTFSVRLRAAYKGEYILPSISCEAMYSPETCARTASGKAVVR